LSHYLVKGCQNKNKNKIYHIIIKSINQQNIFAEDEIMKNSLPFFPDTTKSCNMKYMPTDQ